MNTIKAITILLSLTLLSSSVLAAKVEMKWTDPDEYTDIHAGENNRKHFREQTFKNLDKHFSKLASQLPGDQTLKVEVTNIDLAGTTFHGGMTRIRVVKEMYPPRMEFSYQVVNADNSLILKGEAKLKNMSFMMGRTLRYRNDSLGHEKEMIDKWFTQTFKEQLTDK